MMEHIETVTNKVEMGSGTAVSYDVQYGSASTSKVSSYQPSPTGSLTITRSISFLYSEYVVGVLFVALSSIFILTMPSSLTKAGAMSALFQRVFKRTLDIVGSLVGMVLAAPLFILIPIAIKLESSGPAFYTQTRVGINRRKGSRRYHQRAGVSCERKDDRRIENLFGKPFEVLKFRTMRQDAETVSGPVWATEDDPRVTRVGKLLRKTRLDEIPQFINILIGDMSLVGPRPERPKFVKELVEQVPGYADRLTVKPGLTGLAQVVNGYDSSLDSVVRKVSLDCRYINTWTPWLELKIILKTVKVMFTGKGAH